MSTIKNDKKSTRRVIFDCSEQVRTESKNKVRRTICQNNLRPTTVMHIEKPIDPLEFLFDLRDDKIDMELTNMAFPRHSDITP